MELFRYVYIYIYIYSLASLMCKVRYLGTKSIRSGVGGGGGGDGDVVGYYALGT